MMTPENFKSLALNYYVIKNKVLEQNKPIEEMISEVLECKTPLAKEITSFVGSLNDGRDLATNFYELLYLIYNSKPNSGF